MGWSQKLNVSLIISVYKNVRDLRVVLDGLRVQTYKDFEIIVSEDGESEEMRDFLTSYRHPNHIMHLTQKDVGWRKNQALNQAIRKSSGSYLIFIDGDCVLHHKFIENHVRFSDHRRIVAGKRVKLGPEFSNLVRDEINDLINLEHLLSRKLRQIKREGGRFVEEMIYVDPGGLLGSIARLRSMRELKGCNMSCYKEALIAINGFDEDYILPAIGEDIDLTWRFKGLGYRLFSVRNFAVQYHLYHKENWTDQHENLALMERKMREGRFLCKNGLNQQPE